MTGLPNRPLYQAGEQLPRDATHVVAWVVTGVGDRMVCAYGEQDAREILAAVRALHADARILPIDRTPALQTVDMRILRSEHADQDRAEGWARNPFARADW